MINCIFKGIYVNEITNLENKSINYNFEEFYNTNTFI